MRFNRKSFLASLFVAPFAGFFVKNLGPRKLTEVWTCELSQDLNAYYGLSAEEKIVREMSEYLTAEIDADILSQLTGEPPETFLKKWGKL